MNDADMRVKCAEAWVRVKAPGIDVAVLMDDSDAKAIITQALAIAERRTKLPDDPQPSAGNLTAAETPAGASCHPPAVSGEDSRHPLP